jgi:hypothetical protein
MAGRVPRTPQELFADQAFAEARLDAAERKRWEAGAEAQGKPPPRGPHPWEVKREQQQAAAAAIVTPASKSDLSKVKATIAGLKAKLSGQRSEQVSETPEEYARNYGDGGIRYRSAGSIVRGPY